mmetsp:Transcript_8090/g.19358  ORF Transcript_8090/g.19358 Transcript_8090/m.19358 type:complete len:298 (-) Transcript_8090:746-1639(-)
MQPACLRGRAAPPGMRLRGPELWLEQMDAAGSSGDFRARNARVVMVAVPVLRVRTALYQACSRSKGWCRRESRPRPCAGNRARTDKVPATENTIAAMKMLPMMIAARGPAAMLPLLGLSGTEELGREPSSMAAVVPSGLLGTGGGSPAAAAADGASSGSNSGVCRTPPGSEGGGLPEPDGRGTEVSAEVAAAGLGPGPPGGLLSGPGRGAGAGSAAEGVGNELTMGAGGGELAAGPGPAGKSHGGISSAAASFASSASSPIPSLEMVSSGRGSVGRGISGAGDTSGAGVDLAATASQ